MGAKLGLDVIAGFRLLDALGIFTVPTQVALERVPATSRLSTGIALIIGNGDEKRCNRVESMP